MKNLVDEIRALADRLCHTIGGNFDFVVPYEGQNPEMEKLHMITNFVLDTARRALEDAEATRTQLENKVELRTAELQEEMKKAESASTAKGHFLASVSHEMRTPLAALVGFADLLQNQADVSEEMRLYVNIIRRNSEQLMLIINKVLDLSKIEAGQILVEYEVFDVQQTLLDLLENFRMEFKNRDIGMETRFDLGEAPDARIHSDRSKFIQILTNLVENAMKYTKEGGITVSLEIVCFEEGQDVLVKVQDTGHGIALDFVDQIFTPFARAERHMRSAIPGVGLGLNLSHKLAEVLGGQLELLSTGPDTGSLFGLTLHQSNEDLKAIAKARKHVPSSSLKHKSLEGLKVLVVEDFDENRYLLKKYLEMAGAVVETSTNGLDAIRKTGLFGPSVILMDLQMPIMDGFEATQELRRLGYRIPIVAVTAFALKDEMERSLRSGFDAHLTKPLDSKRLLSCLQSLDYERI